jgi:hypothetical protein
MFDRRNFIGSNGQRRGIELANEWRYVSEDGADASGFAIVQLNAWIGVPAEE